MNYTKQQVIIDLDVYNALKTQEKNFTPYSFITLEKLAS